MPEQLQRMICVFEKAVNFKSPGLSFNDMRCKITLAYPDFEKELYAINSENPSSSQTDADKELVLECAF